MYKKSIDNQIRMEYCDFVKIKFNLIERRCQTINSLQISMKAARVNANLTQQEVCKTLRISPKTLIKWEKGHDSPKVEQFRIICDLYGVNENNIRWG